MAADQKGTGGLTVGGQATQAAVHITVPADSIIETVTYNPGGAPQYEDQIDADGAFHTRITFESTMHTAQVVVVGKAYATAAGEVDGADSNYYIETSAQEFSKGPRRTTINVTRLPTIA
jgi:hypothetical protein